MNKIHRDLTTGEMAHVFKSLPCVLRRSTFLREQKKTFPSLLMCHSPSLHLHVLHTVESLKTPMKECIALYMLIPSKMFSSPEVY